MCCCKCFCFRFLRDSIHKQTSWRETEPTVMKATKKTVLWLIYIALALYFLDLLYKLVLDNPPIQTISITDATFPLKAPYVVFYAPFEFNVTCEFNNINKTLKSSCNDYLNQTNDQELLYTPFYTTFHTANKLLNFSDFLSEPIFDNEYIEFKFFLTNSSKNSLGLFSDLKVRVFDHDTPEFLSRYDKKFSLLPLLEQITDNYYTLSPYQRNTIRFRTIEAKNLKYTVKNFFSIPKPNMQDLNSIETTFQTSNFPSTDFSNITKSLSPDLSFYTYMSLSLWTNLKEIKGEK
ncbi:1997_t:CDS:2, partial [Ambispora leptoticha]